MMHGAQIQRAHNYTFNAIRFYFGVDSGPLVCLLNALLPRNISPTLVYKICSALLPNTQTTVGYLWVWKMLQLFPLHNYNQKFNSNVKSRIDTVQDSYMLNNRVCIKYSSCCSTWVLLCGLNLFQINQLPPAQGKLQLNFVQMQILKNHTHTISWKTLKKHRHEKWSVCVFYEACKLRVVWLVIAVSSKSIKLVCIHTMQSPISHLSPFKLCFVWSVMS